MSKFKHCYVPECPNTSVMTPHKYFIPLPKGTFKRKQWVEAMIGDPNYVYKYIKPSIALYCCEDHFELEQCIENYWGWVGTKTKMVLKPKAMPTIFNRQPGVIPGKPNYQKPETHVIDDDENDAHKDDLTSSNDVDLTTACEIEDDDVPVSDDISNNISEIDKPTIVENDSNNIDCNVNDNKNVDNVIDSCIHNINGTDSYDNENNIAIANIDIDNSENNVTADNVNNGINVDNGINDDNCINVDNGMNVDNGINVEDETVDNENVNVNMDGVQDEENITPEEIEQQKLEDPEILIENVISTDTTSTQVDGTLKEAQTKQKRFERFKRRLITSVAKLKRNGKTDAEIWETLQKGTGRDCEEIWKRMRLLTLKKINKMLTVDDLVAKIPKSSRMSKADWLMFNLVLVFEDIDVITADGAVQDPDSLECLWKLAELFYIASNTSTERMSPPEFWAKITLQYNETGRECSPMLLQKRWYQILEATNSIFYIFWNKFRGRESNITDGQTVFPSKLQVTIADRFPRTLTTEFKEWDTLLKEKQIILLEDFMLLSCNRMNNNIIKMFEIGTYMSPNLRKLQHQEIVTDESDIQLLEPKIDTVNIESDSDDSNGPNDIITPVEQPIIIKQEPVDESEEMAVDGLSNVTIVAATHIQTEEIPNDIDDMDVDLEEKALEELTMLANSEKNISRVPTPLDNSQILTDETIHIEQNDNNMVTEVINEIQDSHDIGDPEITDLVSLNDDEINMETDTEKIVLNINENIADNELTIVKQEIEEPIIMTSINNESISPPDEEILKKSNIDDISLSNIPSNTNIILPQNDLANIEIIDDGIDLIDDDDDMSSDNDEVYDNPIDLKLMMLPVVYTTRLNDMKLFKFADYEAVKSNEIIASTIEESKPISSKSMNIKTEIDDTREINNIVISEDDKKFADDLIKIEVNDNNDNETLDQMNEDNKDEDSSSDDDSDYERLSFSSHLFQKPKHRKYSLIQLCKNPDFNTRLKRLPVTFYTYERNLQFLTVCKPLTIDLDKGFEKKLNDKTIYFIKDEKNIKQEEVDDSEYQNERVSFDASVLPAQSFIDNLSINTPHSFSNQIVESNMHSKNIKLYQPYTELNMKNIVKVTKVPDNQLQTDNPNLNNTSELRKVLEISPLVRSITPKDDITNLVPSEVSDKDICDMKSSKNSNIDICDKKSSENSNIDICDKKSSENSNIDICNRKSSEISNIDISDQRSSDVSKKDNDVRVEPSTKVSRTINKTKPPLRPSWSNGPRKTQLAQVKLTANTVQQNKTAWNYKDPNVKKAYKDVFLATDTISKIIVMIENLNPSYATNKFQFHKIKNRTESIQKEQKKLNEPKVAPIPIKPKKQVVHLTKDQMYKKKCKKLFCCVAREKLMNPRAHHICRYKNNECNCCCKEPYLLWLNISIYNSNNKDKSKFEKSKKCSAKKFCCWAFEQFRSMREKDSLVDTSENDLTFCMCKYAVINWILNVKPSKLNDMLIKYISANPALRESIPPNVLANNQITHKHNLKPLMIRRRSRRSTTNENCNLNKTEGICIDLSDEENIQMPNNERNTENQTSHESMVSKTVTTDKSEQITLSNNVVLEYEVNNINKPTNEMNKEANIFTTKEPCESLHQNVETAKEICNTDVDFIELSDDEEKEQGNVESLNVSNDNHEQTKNVPIVPKKKVWKTKYIAKYTPTKPQCPLNLGPEYILLTTAKLTEDSEKTTTPITNYSNPVPVSVKGLELPTGMTLLLSQNGEITCKVDPTAEIDDYFYLTANNIVKSIQNSLPVIILNDLLTIHDPEEKKTSDVVIDLSEDPETERLPNANKEQTSTSLDRASGLDDLVQDHNNEKSVDNSNNSNQTDVNIITEINENNRILIENQEQTLSTSLDPSAGLKNSAQDQNNVEIVDNSIISIQTDNNVDRAISESNKEEDKDILNQSNSSENFEVTMEDTSITNPEQIDKTNTDNTMTNIQDDAKETVCEPEPTTHNKKSILFDLMEISGISSEDVAPPAQSEILPLDNTTNELPPLILPLDNTTNESPPLILPLDNTINQLPPLINSIQSIPVNIPTSSSSAVELTQVSTILTLRKAVAAGGKFYKYNMINNNITPIKVTIEKIVKPKTPKLVPQLSAPSRALPKKVYVPSKRAIKDNVSLKRASILRKPNNPKQIKTTVLNQLDRVLIKKAKHKETSLTPEPKITPRLDRLPNKKMTYQNIQVHVNKTGEDPNTVYLTSSSDGDDSLDSDDEPLIKKSRKYLSEDIKVTTDENNEVVVPVGDPQLWEGLVNEDDDNSEDFILGA